MQLPYPIVDLTTNLAERWQRNYIEMADRPRDVEEGLWRRTQEEANASESGWTGPGDARRRVLHYRYRYAAVPRGQAESLALVELYLASSVAYPAEELRRHRDQVDQALECGGWQLTREGVFTRGSLRCSVASYEVHPQDRRAGRVLPQGYVCLDVVVTSQGYQPPQTTVDLPWYVLRGGMRVKERRGNPRVVEDLGLLKAYVPFQIEIGCGPSVEAGIPPLHRLHEIYRVTDRASHRFVLDPQADTFLPELLGGPEAKMPELVEMFRACFLAEPSPGHRALRQLVDAGVLVGPVITNNFDGLAARVGLPECYVRRYDQQVPDVPFLPEARALLVVGSHADRRRVQDRARQRGLPVFFVDPEGFWEGGDFVPYPVEGAREGDHICRREAGELLTAFAKEFGNDIAAGQS